jgi:hypothetical protein
LPLAAALPTVVEVVARRLAKAGLLARVVRPGAADRSVSEERRVAGARPRRRRAPAVNPAPEVNLAPEVDLAPAGDPAPAVSRAAEAKPAPAALDRLEARSRAVVNPAPGDEPAAADGQEAGQAEADRPGARRAASRMVA